MVTNSSLDKHWHLAENDTEIELSELESALYRVTAAFDRWTADCIATASNLPLSSTENSILHIIRMKNRPKTISDIGRFLNRDDVPNLQYALRKLLKFGLIEKTKGNKTKSISYKVTKSGEEITTKFAELRRNLLLPLIESVHHWDSLSDSTCRTLELLKGIYDSAALTVSSHRRPEDDID